MIHDKSKAATKPNFGAHAEWKGRLVLWVVRNGVLHVARQSATTAGGIVNKIACGGGSTFPPEGTTWYAVKRRGHKFCRKCIETLKE